MAVSYVRGRLLCCELARAGNINISCQAIFCELPEHYLCLRPFSLFRVPESLGAETSVLVEMDELLTPLSQIL